MKIAKSICFHLRYSSLLFYHRLLIAVRCYSGQHKRRRNRINTSCWVSNSSGFMSMWCAMLQDDSVAREDLRWHFIQTEMRNWLWERLPSNMLNAMLPYRTTTGTCSFGPSPRLNLDVASRQTIAVNLSSAESWYYTKSNTKSRLDQIRAGRLFNFKFKSDLPV